MFLKILIFAIVAAVIYRLFGGKLPFIDKKSTQKEEHEFGQIEATSECAHCGTYMTEEDAIIYHRKAYCSQKCLDAVKKS
ncbi:MAG TPA: hypothetical protein ENK86_00260 [Campylobacterales bacterium]|nr:hypothetical protein [Campylobacterales bacterium]